MRPLHILLLEDDINDLQQVINVLSEHYSITTVNSFQKAKNVLASSYFDFAILDISINGKPEGIEVAKHIQTLQSPIPFLFLTATQSRTVFEQAKLTLPFTYLLKPFNVLELQYSIELSIEKHFQQENRQVLNKEGVLTADYIFVKKQGKIFKVVINDIEYVEVEENYCMLCSKSEKHMVRLSLTKLKDILLQKKFIQIHRKILVNLNEVKALSLSENTVYLNSGSLVTISDRYKKKFLQDHSILK
ncbi:LytR/AlgR family response regulator transcription factor [Flavivirga spongiicola]|uniref:Response regulator transcription factor n=1 Tax=Flavivirga spongiicola TaxID=421621 RepID=A0ABU7XUE0_9FLAO|nr:response regulator transcription factor [Flavivirga sp. MEBiC05379]MDO5979401.1 response regulator transcription factor [Flavivirga sp. MEBiC05379]